MKQSLALSRDRLYPSLRNPNYLVLSKRRKIFAAWLGRIAENRLRVLDVGGRLQPYRPLLGQRVVSYVAVDVWRTPLVNVVAKGEALPFRDDCFDLVFCTQVLQWIPDPELVVDEIYRVLKPHGHLLLSASAAEPLSCEQDYWRFTPASLQRLLRGFSAVTVAPEGSTVSGFFRTVSVYLNLMAKFRPVRAALSAVLFPLLNTGGLTLEKVARTNNTQFSVNYSVLARK